jgi:endonuclease III-like uncharacterized protein
MKRKPSGFYNDKQNVLNAANVCESLAEFHNLFRGAYNSALKNKWLTEINKSFKMIDLALAV